MNRFWVKPVNSTGASDSATDTMKPYALLLAFLAAAGLIVLSQVGQSPPADTASHQRQSSPVGETAFVPLTPGPALPADKVALGARLFHDGRLSRDNTVACASCHDLGKGGTDRRAVSVGVGGQTGDRNAPTVFNAGFNFVQFWDGRAASLEEQAAGPIHNPLEMGSNWNEVISKLKGDPHYAEAFARIYGGPPTETRIADAIACFERSLVTPDSPFDRFLKGDLVALSPRARAGFQRFQDYGCASCHQGVLLGGNMYQRFGVMEDFFRGRPERATDLGRFNVTRSEEDRHVFKVPGLRNVALTGPYFHDGSALTLEEAVVVMGRVQLGRDLPAQDVRDIVAFLHSLSGHWQGEALQ